METLKTLNDAEKRTLDITEIASLIREQLKKEFPKCKFAVTTSRYSMGQSLTVNLMTAPFDAYAGADVFSSVNHFHLANSERYTPEAKVVLLRAVEIANQFNYNNSDSMTDYYDVNFSFSLELGKWNKPFTKK